MTLDFSACLSGVPWSGRRCQAAISGVLIPYAQIYNLSQRVMSYGELRSLSEFHSSILLFKHPGTLRTRRYKLKSYPCAQQCPLLHQNLQRPKLNGV